MSIESNPDALPKVNAFDIEVEMIGLPEEDVVAGPAAEGWKVLHQWRGIDIGVHSFAGGAAYYEDTDQVFVILAGSATVTWPDGSMLDVGAGDVVALKATGSKLKWTIHETLRKVYLYSPGE
ncbi:MAG: cupin domain-containing protein [Actinomycetota bacterium]|nr:cupin domain-containing protein [Actinomycetota bacterium]